MKCKKCGADLHVIEKQDGKDKYICLNCSSKKQYTKQDNIDFLKKMDDLAADQFIFLNGEEIMVREMKYIMKTITRDKQGLKKFGIQIKMQDESIINISYDFENKRNEDFLYCFDKFHRK